MSQQQPQVNKKPTIITTEQAFAQLAVENGSNLSRLIALQEQQTIYINILFNMLSNESQKQQEDKPIDNGSRTEKDQTIPTKTK